MVAEREKEIKQFKPRPFYGLQAESTNGLSLNWSDQNNNGRIFDKEKANQILAKVKGQKARVVSVNRSEKRSFSPPLHDLSSLQQAANKAFGFSGKETLSIIQRLYERHKLLTYPRKDSKFLSSDIVPTLKDRVESVAVGE